MALVLASVFWGSEGSQAWQPFALYSDRIRSVVLVPLCESRFRLTDLSAWPDHEYKCRLCLEPPFLPVLLGYSVFNEL